MTHKNSTLQPTGIARVMAFDFGMKRTGVAVGQTITGTANALTTLTSRQPGQPDWTRIQKLLQEWRPDALVVGIPVNLDNKEQAITHAARGFAKKLRSRFQLPVFEVDERLTSKAANREFIQARQNGQARRKDIKKLDAHAAKHILETWLKTLQ